MRLKGTAAIISGGAGGQGAAEARLFAQEGTKVVTGDVLEAEGTKTAAQIAEGGGDALGVRLDVTKEEDWKRVVDTAVKRFGKVDILVNNAGIVRMGNVEETTTKLWDEVMNVNAKGVFFWYQGGHPGDAEGGRRLHRQHLLGSRNGGRLWLGGLHQLQGRCPAAHQGHRSPVR